MRIWRRSRFRTGEVMGSKILPLSDDLVKVLETLDQPLERAALELMVMELYRREKISSGKAAQLLGMPKLDFIQYSGELGIPFFRMDLGELEREVRMIEQRYPAR
jgi:predicted HTH domain antitoxin